MKRWRIAPLAVGFALALAAGLISSAATAAAAQPQSRTFLGRLGTPTQVASTVPANGDVNPYGIAVVPHSVGLERAGSTLISNFNDMGNTQGTGTTIVQVSPQGNTTLFSQIGSLPAGSSCPGGIGLTTALGILPGGWVVVGSLPTQSDGSLPSVNPAGCLLVLNPKGTVVETFTNPDIDGPWDMTVATYGDRFAQLFVSNALGTATSTNPSDGSPVAGEGSVVRLDVSLSGYGPPQLVRTTVIGSDFPFKADPNALILAPTGLALSHGALFVDDTDTSSISRIPDPFFAMTPVTAADTTITSGGALNGPLGMTATPHGRLIVVNGDDGNAVEVTPDGRQVAVVTLIPNGAGDLFGLTLTPYGNGLLFVNDGTNALDQALRAY